jgi:hypothetical protein
VILAVLATRAAGADCTFTEPDYYALRQQLRALRRTAGGPLGVVPSGPACAEGLEAVLANGPFLGVHEAAEGEVCAATLEPGEDGGGWQIRVDSACRVDGHAPQGMVSIGPWLPYGVSARYDREVVPGMSVLLDVGWAPPRLWDDPFDLGSLEGTNTPESSAMRALIGFDITRDDLGGAYFGARAGVEAATPAEGPVPRYGVVSFVGGRRWLSVQGITLQLGGGLMTEMPLLEGPQPSLLSPVGELRVGWAGRR